MQRNRERHLVLITGASRGIGAGIARMAAARGYDVAITYQSDIESAMAVANDCRSLGAAAQIFQCEVSDEKQVETLFDAVTDQMGIPTRVVSNAGITGKSSRIEDADPKTIRRCIEVNVLGTAWVARETARRLSIKRGGPGGSLVVISSIGARLGVAGSHIWYAASKGAINSFVFGLGQELALDGIRVNTVSPGMTRSDLHERTGDPARVARLVARIPMQRIGEPEEIAEAVLFMLSDAASFITASDLAVAGGR